MHTLTGKTILLTGAAGGIGSAIAQALHNEGAVLLLSDRNEAALENLQKGLGSQHAIITADISAVGGRQKLAQYCDSLEQEIDYVVNLAGVNQFNLLQDFTDDEIAQILHINLFSQIALTRELLPTLLKQNQACIVNFGSTLGSIGLPGYSIYSASKFGLRGFSEALKRELMDTNVSVKYFAPRATQTSLNTDKVSALNKELGTAMDRVEDVADSFVNFLRSNQSRYYLGWPEKLFVRINALFPSIVDNAISKQLSTFKKYLNGDTK